MQTADEEMEFFTDEHRHPYFHCNNLWFDLEALLRVLTQRQGVLKLPLIRNAKTVDPKDSSSPEVIQIESAMGAAVEVFEGAQAICVPRRRFLPAKTTNELLLLRSDAYDVTAEGDLQLTVEPAPVVDGDLPVIELMYSMKSSGSSTSKTAVMSASLEMIQSASTARSGNLLSNVAAFSVFRIHSSF